MTDTYFSFLKSEFPEYKQRCLDAEINTVEGNYVQAVIGAGNILEDLTKDLAKRSDLEFIAEFWKQHERLKELEKYRVIPYPISTYFYKAKNIRNIAGHNDYQITEDHAYRMNRFLFKIMVWFYQTYSGDSKFIPPRYKGPLYESPKDNHDELINKNTESIRKQEESIQNLTKKLEELSLKIDKVENNNEEIILKPINIEEKDEDSSNDEIDDGNIVEEVFTTNHGSYLINELKKLKGSSLTAVASDKKFNNFNQYMHIKRPIEEEFINKLKEVAASNSSHLVLLCGSVGDGKSHLLSYLQAEHRDLAEKFKIFNDGTESDKPKNDANDTLAEHLVDFNDDNYNTSNKKCILAINLGVLSNFIESDYATSDYATLSQVIKQTNILDANNFAQEYDKGVVSIISFSEYNIFKLFGDNSDYRVWSDYIYEMINKIVSKDSNNNFYKAYLMDKEIGDYKGPVLYNYEMLSSEKVKKVVVNLVIKIIFKYKRIISTRELLNFIYEIIVPPVIQEYDSSYEISDYSSELLPNLLFAKNTENFLRFLYLEDPTNLRFKSIDNMIIDLNIIDDIFYVIDEYIDDSEIPFFKDIFKEFDLDNKERDKFSNLSLNRKQEIIELLIRFAFIYGKEDLINLFVDEDYKNYLDYLYYYNSKNYGSYAQLFDDIQDAVFKWCGSINGNLIINHLNSFNIAKKLELTPVINNTVEDIFIDDEGNLGNRFKTDIVVSFSVNGHDKDDEIIHLNVDYPLYKSIIKLTKGFKPNKNEQRNFAIFKKFVDDIIRILDDENKLIIKNLNDDKIFSFNQIFDKYTFEEVE